MEEGGREQKAYFLLSKVFFCCKGLFGEKTRAKTIPNMIKEVKRRFWAYQRMKRYADDRVSA